MLTLGKRRTTRISSRRTNESYPEFMGFFHYQSRNKKRGEISQKEEIKNGGEMKVGNIKILIFKT